MIEAIIEGAEDDKRVKMLGYTCESGSPLHAAITGQKPLETTQLLIDKFEAISVDEGDVDYVETMVNLKDLSHIHPLYLSVFMGNIEVTKLLIDQGADPMSASDSSGVTLLHICAERGYSEIASLLCEVSPTLIF